MTFDEYQAEAMKTAVNATQDFEALMYRTLGLTSEAGEVADKIKKIIRDKAGQIGEAEKAEIAKELGDVLWYLQALSHWLDMPFSHIAHGNLEKLKSRKKRDKISGSGDNR